MKNKSLFKGSFLVLLCSGLAFAVLTKEQVQSAILGVKVDILALMGECQGDDQVKVNDLLGTEVVTSEYLNQRPLIGRDKNVASIISFINGKVSRIFNVNLQCGGPLNSFWQKTSESKRIGSPQRRINRNYRLE